MSAFDEWRQEQALAKGPTGGITSPVSPGFGFTGPGATPGPSPRPAPGSASDDVWFGSNSKYNVPHARPDPWINDVDMAENWYSPMQPVWPFATQGMDYTREWDYPTGYNLNFVQQRMNLMSMLRGMRSSWGVLATIIATRQDQLLRIPWTIQQKGHPRGSSVGVKEMLKFFKRPDGKRSYSQWTRLITDDLLVLDQPCISVEKNRGGKVTAVERIDPITIFPLIDDAGRRPDAPSPAYQQIIKGLPMTNLTEDELIYAPMRPNAAYPMFGYPGTEQIFIEASEAIRKTFYQLNFWSEGTIPDLIVTVPKEWSPRQIAMFQGHFDALLSGNLRLKSKVRFLPGDMKPFDIKNSSGESLWSQRDETLIRLACYAYSVSPTPFVKQLNRSVAQNAQQASEEEGLYPLMSFWKDDIMDVIIQEKCGFEDVEFVFLPRPEPDSEKQAKIHQIYVKEGIRSRNEVRAEIGLEPQEGGDVPLIELGNVIVPVADAAKGEASVAAQAGINRSTDNDGPSKPPSKRGKSTDSRGQPQRGPAKANHLTPTPSSAPVAKASKSELREAARQAQGDVREQPHKVLHDGNYQKGHIWIQGLNISIENKKGSKRGEKDQNGIKWSVRMPTPYGYIRGTIGADGDAVDVYLGKNPNSKIVWVIDQNKVSKKGKIKGFDEHKVMIGYKKLKKAVKDYLDSHFDNKGHDRLETVVELSMKEFKDWLKNGDTKKPITDAGIGRVVLTQGDLKKADTISSGTGLAWYSQLGSDSSRSKKKKLKSGARWTQLSAQVA